MTQVTCSDGTFISYLNAKFQDSIPVRPIENTIHSSATKIFKFLDKRLRPIFDDKCKTTTIVDGASLINELHKYIKKGLFRPSTFFCTMNIRNLHTMLQQEKALGEDDAFLDVDNYTKVKGIDLNTIKELASIVLTENVFVYENNIYQQTTAGAMGSSLTLTLANVFTWQWQKELVRRQDMIGEFYGR